MKNDNLMYEELLRYLTVVSRDNGAEFTVADRRDVLMQLLSGSDYELVSQTPLSLVYARKDAELEHGSVLISSHIDSVYENCFVEDSDEYWKGTFDNSATNAALVMLMLTKRLPANVIVAFTGDEELDSRGAMEVTEFIVDKGVPVGSIVVLDVTNGGWESEVAFSIENDALFDILTGYNLIAVARNSGVPFAVRPDAEPDEAADYLKFLGERQYPLPIFTLCLPVGGDMHSEEGTLMRKSSVVPFCDYLVKVVSEVL